jgi:hypothetical protein
MENNLRTQKDNLAKLMATEDLTIIHKKIPTAYFDIKNRILACPIFKDDLSSSLYDLFMGHEVGHALHTPLEGLHSTLKENRTLKGYLNVVEDVRIERKIREKYAGLRKSFYTAYNELMEMDFFQLKGRDLQELSLIDKINLITKCGSRVNIKLTDEEQVFLDMSEKCDTWEEVVECATAIYEWSKENETRTEADEQLVPQMFDIGDDEEDEEERRRREEMERLAGPNQYYQQYKDRFLLGGFTPQYSTGDVKVGTTFTKGLGQYGFEDGGGVFPRRVGGIMPDEGTPGKDSVKAMLMPGEFVMTTNAVKGLGDGDNNKGISRMYDMMRGLEAKGKAMA